MGGGWGVVVAHVIIVSPLSPNPFFFSSFRDFFGFQLGLWTRAWQLKEKRTFEQCSFFVSDIEIFTSYNLRKLFFIEKSINAAKFSNLIKVDNYEVSDKGGDLSPGLLCWGQQKRLDTVFDSQLAFQIGEALGHHMGHGQQVTCIQKLADIEIIDLQRQAGKFVKVSGIIFWNLIEQVKPSNLMSLCWHFVWGIKFL